MKRHPALNGELWATAKVLLGRTTRRRTIHIGKPEAKFLRILMDDLSLLDDQIGGDQLWRWPKWLLQRVEEVFDDRRFDTNIEAELTRITGELKRAVGWFYFDSGYQQSARNYFNQALNLGYLTNDYFLISRTIANMTRQTIDQRLGRRTAWLAHQTIQNYGKHLTPSTRAVLAAREAHGWAIYGDRKACEIALAAAHREFDSGQSDRDPNWVSFYISEEQLAWHEGMCRSDLGQYASAARLLETSAKQHKDDFRRDLAICLIRLASNSLSMDEIEQGAAYAQKAAALAGKLTSARVTGALFALRSQLAHYQKIAPARDVLDQLNDGNLFENWQYS